MVVVRGRPSRKAGETLAILGEYKGSESCHNKKYKQKNRSKGLLHSILLIKDTPASLQY
jgi:hypothetical protein